jgi:thiamine pyrophosphokinase
VAEENGADNGPAEGARRVLVIGDGDVPSRADLDAAWPGWANGISLVIAADGGFRRALALGLQPDLVVGDGDSLGAGELDRLAAAGMPIERSPTAKDESDTELAVLAALRRGATAITFLGALGGERLDHALANVGLLALPELAAVSAVLLDASVRIRLLRAPGPAGEPARLDLAGEPGDVVSLIPQGPGVRGVTTTGLRYPLRDEPLPEGPARGLSNVRIEPEASVALRSGHLLVVESRPGSVAREGAPP